MRSRLAPSLLALGLLAAACGGGSSNAPAGDESASPALEGVRDGLTSRVHAGEMELEVSGAVEGRFSGPTPINVLTNVGGRTPPEFWQLTVGILPQHILEFDGGMKIRPALDVIGFEGNGSYTIGDQEGGGLSEEELAALRENPDQAVTPNSGFLPSGVVFVVSQDDDQDITNFNAIEEPCTVDVSNGGHRGTIDCPEVSNGTETVSFSWSWNTDPDDVLEDLVTASQGGDTNGDATNGDGSPNDGDEEDAPGGSSNGGNREQNASGDRYGLEKPYRLDLDITPDDCATRGTAAVVEVDTIPNASITMVVVYSDAQPHGNTTLGTTGPTGTFTWAFNVAATAPEGQADLIINVRPDEGSDETESAGGIVPAFEVKTLC